MNALFSKGADGINDNVLHAGATLNASTGSDLIYEFNSTVPTFSLDFEIFNLF